MRKRLAFWCVICFFGMSSWASAMEWQQLDAMRQAIQEQNYRGEFLHRRGDKTSVYNIVHQYKQGDSVELLKQLDGDMVEVLRNGEQLICYYPEGSENALNHAVPAAPFSQVNALDLTRISENYRASSQGVARVAGYKAYLIELAGDEWRYKQRFWLEAETNLLLQSELIDSDGSVLEQFRFTRIEFGVQIDDEELVPSLEGNSTALQQTAYKADGKTPNEGGFLSELNWLPSGYVLTFSERKNSEKGWIEQRTYSDGLTSFSVFVEQGKRSTSQQSALAKMGATSALMSSVDKASVTVIGEIPSKTAKQIVSMLSIESSSI